MCLRFVFLLIMRLAEWLRLSRCEEAWETAEILILRHQLARQYETHHNQHRPHRSPNAAAPLKPLPEPVDPDQYHVRRPTHVGPSPYR